MTLLQCPVFTQAGTTGTKQALAAGPYRFATRAQGDADPTLLTIGRSRV
jgi:hypothetical protein